MVPIPRKICEYENLGHHYKLTKREFDIQYFAFYNARYDKMIDWLRDAATKKWPNVDIITLNDLMDRKNEQVVIIGTLLKTMKLQPSVLKEVSEDLELIPEAPRDKYTDETDYLRLQDKTESVILEGLTIGEFVTGVMLCCLGHETDNGNKFVVEDHCFSTPAPQRPLKYAAEDIYICLVSDLGVSTKPDKVTEEAREYFARFLSGAHGTKVSSKIARVIIAGNTLADNTRDYERQLEENVGYKGKGDDEWSRKERAYTVESLKLMDDFLCKIGRCVNVDVMPGPLDATSILMPQQPLHTCILPKSHKLESIRCVTNPYLAAFEGLVFQGTSGQNISAIYELTDYAEPVDIMDQTIAWRHLVPSAPDSVSSFPFTKDDPFALTQTPHVYFAGNQRSFNMKRREDGDMETLMIAVPSFKLTRTCVLVNLKDLKCHVIAFD